MSKSDFAKLIIAQLSGAIGTDGGRYSASSASAAMSAIAGAITNYLIANTKVMISYVGTIPGTPPTPDPIVTDTFKIIGTCAPPGPANNFDAWIKQLEANIIAGFQLAPICNNGVVFATKPFLTPGIMTTQDMMKDTHDIADKSPQQKIWETICGGIMDWINSTAINSTPGVAMRSGGPSTGTATIVNITIT